MACFWTTTPGWWRCISSTFCLSHSSPSSSFRAAELLLRRIEAWVWEAGKNERQTCELLQGYLLTLLCINSLLWMMHTFVPLLLLLVHSNWAVAFSYSLQHTFKEIWIFAPLATSFSTSAVVFNSNTGRKPPDDITFLIESYYQRYYHNLNCTWMLKAEQGSYVNLEIEYFKVKNNLFNMNSYNVIFYNMKVFLVSWSFLQCDFSTINTITL